MTIVSRYSPQSVISAYARSAYGLVFTLGPLCLLQPAPWIAAVLAVGASVFLVYALRSLTRHVTRVWLDETGIRTRGPFATVVRWDELHSLRLTYYALRRDHAGGWMSLAIRGSRSSIWIESSLEEFAGIAARAAREALRRHCVLDERTRFNLAAMGVVLDPQPDFPNNTIPGSSS